MKREVLSGPLNVSSADFNTGLCLQFFFIFIYRFQTKLSWSKPKCVFAAEMKRSLIKRDVFPVLSVFWV